MIRTFTVTKTSKVSRGWKALVCAASLLSVFLVSRPAPAEVVDRIIAIINESIITLSELNAATALATEQMSANDKKDPKKMAELKTKVLDRLMEQKLIKQSADKAGIDVSEKEIDNAVDEVKKQNNLSHESLLLALAQNGLTYKEYRESLKEQIRQVKFINKEFRSKISIQPEEIEDYYKQHIEEYHGAPSYRAKMIFIEAADKNDKHSAERLKTILAALSNGDDFSEVARQYSDGNFASAGGDLGYIKAGESDKVLEDAVSKLIPGATSGVITKPEGYYIVQLIDKKRGAPKPLEEVKSAIHEKLFNKAMESRFSFWLSEVKKFAHIEVRM